ncbi:MAG: hypothetical protein WCL14_03150 [Bacteroidota bacterium]
MEVVTPNRGVLTPNSKAFTPNGGGLDASGGCRVCFLAVSELGRGSGAAPKAVLCLWRDIVWAAKTERSEPV